MFSLKNKLIQLTLVKFASTNMVYDQISRLFKICQMGHPVICVHLEITHVNHIRLSWHLLALKFEFEFEGLLHPEL